MPRSHLERDESGLALTEYLALLGLLTAATILGVLSFGTALDGAWGRITSLYASISVASASSGVTSLGEGLDSGGTGGQDPAQEEPVTDGGDTQTAPPPPADDAGDSGKVRPCDNGIINSGGAAGNSKCGGKK